MKSRRESVLKFATIVLLMLVGSALVTPGHAQRAGGNGGGNGGGGGGSGGGFCQITLLQAGNLAASIDNMALSSRLAGGAAGIANVETDKQNYEISIDAMQGFNQSPIGGSDDMNMSVLYSGTGSTNFSETAGNLSVGLNKGITRVETHLVAVRNTDPFPAGDYGAELILRCE